MTSAQRRRLRHQQRQDDFYAYLAADTGLSFDAWQQEQNAKRQPRPPQRYRVSLIVLVGLSLLCVAVTAGVILQAWLHGGKGQP